jgi:hypothetical protein
MAYAQKPHSFTKTFVIQEANNNGIMAFNVYVRGKPMIVVVDDIIPFIYNNNKLIPAFAQIGLDGALHGPLLEKMWAKVNGNYERTAAGWQNEALRVLSGAPANDYLCSSYSTDEIWDLIKSAVERDFIIGAGTAGSGNDRILNQFGLSESHAFAVLGVYELKNESGQVVERLL